MKFTINTFKLILLSLLFLLSNTLHNSNIVSRKTEVSKIKSKSADKHRNTIIQTIEKAFRVKVKTMQYLKQLFMGMLIEKITPFIGGELNLLAFIQCMKKKLVNLFSIKFLKTSFNGIIALGKDVGSWFIKAFKFFKSSFSKAYKSIKSLTKMKKFIVSVKDNVMELFNTLTYLFEKMMKTLNFYLNPFGTCQKSSTKEDKKGKSIGGRFKKAWNSVKTYAGKKLNFVKKWVGHFTPYGMLIKIGMNPKMVKDVIFLSNELILNGLYYKKFKKVDWIGVGERIARVIDFLLIK